MGPAEARRRLRWQAARTQRHGAIETRDGRDLQGVSRAAACLTDCNGEVARETEVRRRGS